MTADEPMSTPDSGGLREAAMDAAAHAVAREFIMEALSWAETTTGGRLGHERAEALLAAHEARLLAPEWWCTENEAPRNVPCCTACIAAEDRLVPTPDSADDATVGDRCSWPGACACSHRPCRFAAPPADDAHRAPVSGGLDEGERSAIVKALYDFPHAGAKWLTFRNGVWAAVERILAARDAAWVERLAAMERERDLAERFFSNATENVAKYHARAEAAEAEHDTARREAGERIAQAIEAEAGNYPRGRTSHTLDVAARIARADALTSDDGSGA